MARSQMAAPRAAYRLAPTAAGVNRPNERGTVTGRRLRPRPASTGRQVQAVIETPVLLGLPDRVEQLLIGVLGAGNGPGLHQPPARF